MMGPGPDEYSRVDRPLSSASQYYNKLAPWYDILAASEKRFIRAGLKLLDPQPDERILEIGFGTGYALERIIFQLKNGYCAGIDLSPTMASLARKKLLRGDLMARAGLVCSDSLPIPFATNTFDAVFSSFTLELFDTPQIPILLGECRRVLSSNGRLVIVSLSKDEPLGIIGRLYEKFHERYPTLADCRPIPAHRILVENGYSVEKKEFGTMWGLPVVLLSGSP